MQLPMPIHLCLNSSPAFISFVADVPLNQAKNPSTMNACETTDQSAMLSPKQLCKNNDDTIPNSRQCDVIYVVSVAASGVELGAASGTVYGSGRTCPPIGLGTPTFV